LYLCRARENPELNVGDEVVILNGDETGSILTIELSADKSQFLGRWIFPPADNPRSRRFLNLPFELLGKSPIPWPPFWFPPLSMRETFIIDELATWFCNRGLATGNFVWNERDLDEVVRVLWEKRLPVEADEMIQFFCSAWHADNCPPNFQIETRKRSSCLAMGERSPPNQKIAL
jgi:hypothetical protein